MLIKNAIYLPILVALTTACTGGGGSSNGPGPLSANNVSAEPKVKFEAFAEDMKASELEEIQGRFENSESIISSFDDHYKSGQKLQSEELTQYRSGLQFKTKTNSAINQLSSNNMIFGQETVVLITGLSIPVEVKQKSTHKCTLNDDNQMYCIEESEEPNISISQDKFAQIQSEVEQKSIQCSLEEESSSSPESSKNEVSYGNITLADGQKLIAKKEILTRKGKVLCRNTQNDTIVSELSGSRVITTISLENDNQNKLFSQRNAKVLVHNIVQDDNGNVLSITKNEVLGFN